MADAKTALHKNNVSHRLALGIESQARHWTSPSGWRTGRCAPLWRSRAPAVARDHNRGPRRSRLSKCGSSFKVGTSRMAESTETLGFHDLRLHKDGTGR